MSAMASQAQLSTNQFKQVTSMIKTSSDNLYKEINWLKMQRTNDMLRIAFLENLTAQHSIQIKVNSDSIISLNKLIPSYLTLYVDTLTGLKFKQDTLYFKK